MSDSEKRYIIRVESARANTYGLGEVISDGVFLFKSDHYGLTKPELDAAIARTGKKGNKHENG